MHTHSTRRSWRFAFATLCAPLALAACAPLTRPPGVSCLKDAEVVPENPDKPYAVQVSPRAAGFGGQASPAAAAPRPRLLHSLARLAEAAPTPDVSLATRPAIPARRELAINVLVLSGGGQWGAYGSGFLNGLYAVDATPQPAGETPELDLADYNLITGVSTGALMTPIVWSATILDRRRQHQEALDTLAELKGFLQPLRQRTFRRQESVAVGDRLQWPRRSQGAGEDRPRSAHQRRAGSRRSRQTSAMVGAVDLDDGMFYAFDLGDELREPCALKIDCLAQSLLASAAIPLSFPPRFIDSQPFVDGGVRFLAFIDALTTGLRQLRGRRFGS